MKAKPAAIAVLLACCAGLYLPAGCDEENETGEDWGDTIAVLVKNCLVDFTTFTICSHPDWHETSTHAYDTCAYGQTREYHVYPGGSLREISHGGDPVWPDIVFEAGRRLYVIGPGPGDCAWPPPMAPLPEIPNAWEPGVPLGQPPPDAGTNGTGATTTTFLSLCDRFGLSRGEPTFAMDCSSFIRETDYTYNGLGQVEAIDFKYECTDGSAGTYEGRVSDIERDFGGNATSYVAVVNGEACTYP